MLSESEIITLIEKHILKGLYQTCKDLRLFSSDDDIIIKPEYLISVNIAKSISEVNKHQLIPLLDIKLEEKTSSFSINSVPIFSKVSDMFDIFTQKIRGFNNTSRNGNIDITIYLNSNPLTAIEVKQVNPSNKLVKKDIARIEELLYIKDKHTGETSVDQTYFTSFEICKKSKLDSEIIEHIKNTKIKYRNMINSSVANDNTKHEITIKEIPNETFSMENKILENEDIHFFKKSTLSVLIKLYR